MSRTKNTKHDFQEKLYDYEFPDGFSKYNVDIEPGGVYHNDISGTTRNENDNPHYECVRHPNKRKKRGSLGREFTKNRLSGTRYWRNRFGEEADKSSRMRLTKQEMTQRRRHRMKEETKDIVNEELNNI